MPFLTTPPFAGLATTATLVRCRLPLASVSLATTLIVTGVFTDVAALSFLATGGTFAGCTLPGSAVTVTVATFDVAPRLSLAV